jgi:hypothetical protein
VVFNAIWQNQYSLWIQRFNRSNVVANQDHSTAESS